MLRKTLILCLIAAVASCAGVQTEKEADLHYKLGVSSLKDGKYQAAFVEFQRALELNKHDKDIYNALGYVYIKFEDLDKAKQSFEKAVKIDPEFSDAYNNLCLVDYGRKEFSEAVSSCQRALSNPLYATPEKAFFNLGRAYYRLKDYDGAAKAFNSAIIRAGDYYPAYYMLALAYNAKDDFGSASDALDKAVKFDPHYKGDLSKAEKDFRNGLNLPVEKADASQLVEIFKY
ncbi:MAG: tetratricopeptide repeat protein [Nitrospiraceae bacterium]|nr:tetratricopeptide repeat protein [Nitrospiraceae bacterium]